MVWFLRNITDKITIGPDLGRKEILLVYKNI